HSLLFLLSLHDALPILGGIEGTTSWGRTRSSSCIFTYPSFRPENSSKGNSFLCRILDCPIVSLDRGVGPSRSSCRAGDNLGLHIDRKSTRLNSSHQIIS